MTVRLVGIDHVQLSMPEGGEDAARRFYGAVLGLREVAKPPELAGRGGCWFAGAGLAVHLGEESGFRPLVKAHPALLVRDLLAAREALTAVGVAVEDDDSGLPVRRCYVHDPFGNRLELVHTRDSGVLRALIGLAWAARDGSAGAGRSALTASCESREAP